MMNSFLKKFIIKQELIETLANDICTILEECIEKKGKASFLVSGGNTPKALFEKLSKKDILWEKVNIGLADERWVETSSKDSNENLVRRYLLQNRAKDANFFGLYIEEIDILKADELCSKVYSKELYPFDVLLLGMGSDAHTASLFPNNKKLKEAFDLTNENLCINIKPTKAPYERMSLTLKAILDAKNIFLHIEGEQKLKIYNEALLSNDFYKTPISAVLNHDSKEVEVYAYE